jgi:hypothetical protein
MAMKCITQMPVIPTDRPATSNQPRRAEPSAARAREVQRRPRKAPTNDIR